jgi:hypothetical protein
MADVRGHIRSVQHLGAYISTHIRVPRLVKTIRQQSTRERCAYRMMRTGRLLDATALRNALTT